LALRPPYLGVFTKADVFAVCILVHLPIGQDSLSKIILKFIKHPHCLHCLAGL